MRCSNYASDTAGFELLDLKDAKTLLDELTSWTSKREALRRKDGQLVPFRLR